MTRFVVVGGGLAGLLAAYRLSQAGAAVVLVEARPVVGGTLAAIDVGGIRLDAGAESFATRDGTVAALAAELGLAEDVVLPSGGPAWLHPGSRPPAPLPATSLLGIPAHPLRADVVRAVGALAAMRAAADRFLPRGVGGTAASVAELVRMRMGRGVLDALVTPVVVGVHSADPAELPLDQVAPGLRAALASEGSLARAVLVLRSAAPAGSPVAGLRGGVVRFVEALVARLGGVDIRLGAFATDIEPDGVVVDGEPLRGTVVLAAPREVDRRVHLVTLVVDDERLDRGPRGSGVLVAPGAGLPVRALTHATAKWAWLADAAGPGRHVVRLSADVELEASVARQIAGRLLGIELPVPVDARTVHWTRAAADRETRIPTVGEAVAGTGLANVVRHTEARIARLLETGL